MRAGIPKNWRPGVIAPRAERVAAARISTPANWQAPWRVDSTSLCEPCDNQGNIPSCDGWASSNHAEVWGWVETHIPVTYDGLATYYEAKRIDGAPNEDGTDGISGMQAAINLRQLPAFSGGVPVKGWRPRYLTSIDDIKFAIHRWRSCVLLFQIREGWDNPGADGYIPAGGKVLGGHAVLGNGYDDQGLWFLNQWGAQWAVDGNARLRWEDAQAQLMGGVVAEPIAFPVPIGTEATVP